MSTITQPDDEHRQVGREGNSISHTEVTAVLAGAAAVVVILAVAAGEFSLQSLQVIGRVLFAAMLLYTAVSHFTRREATTRHEASAGLRGGKAAMIVTGVMLLLGGLSLLLGIWIDVGALLIVAVLIPLAILMHPFWATSDSAQRGDQQAHFMKNIALVGGAFAFAFIALWLGDALDWVIGPVTALPDLFN